MIRLRVSLLLVPLLSTANCACVGPCQAQYPLYGPVPVGYYAKSNPYTLRAEDTPVEILSNSRDTSAVTEASEASKVVEAEEYEKKLAELKLLRPEDGTSENTVTPSPSAYLPTYSRTEVYTRPMPYRPQPYVLPLRSFQPSQYAPQPVPILQSQYARIPLGCQQYYPQYLQPPRYFPQPIPQPTYPQPLLPPPTTPAPFVLPTLPPLPPPPPNPFAPLQPLNDCCGRCHAPCHFKNKRVAAGVTSHLANNGKDSTHPRKDSKCANEQLRKIMKRHTASSEQLYKRLIQKEAEEQIGGLFFVVCSKDDFSYVSRSDNFCTTEENGIVCYAFQHR